MLIIISYLMRRHALMGHEVAGGRQQIDRGLCTYEQVGDDKESREETRTEMME